MFRSLHAQLIAIVVTTVTVVLAVSQAVDSHLTVRAVEQDLKQRAELVLHAVDSLWTDSPPAELHDALAEIMHGDREITAIDVFRLHGASADVEVSTRPLDQRADAALSADEVAQLERHAALFHALPPHDGATAWRLSIPLSREGAVQGAARVDVRSTDAARLVARIRLIDGVVLLCSIALISVILTLFLNRRVARPVGELVDGMRRVERGDLAARVAPRPAGEFRFLGERFNAMVSRLQALTGHLGEQVRRATADLAQRNDQLQAANERLWQTQLELGRGERLAALGQMAGTLAHELGTPLNSVLGYVQLLRREPLGADQLDKLGIVESQLRRMIDEIRGVLGRTRDVPLRRTPVVVAALVADALTLISARLTARAVQAETDLPGDLPTVPADALGLRQVLLNLLSNAIDATPAGGVIRIAVAVVPAGARATSALELTVADSGHGMSLEELRRAFEPFYTTKAPDRGTGLGLVIVEHIVRAHGGEVAAESTPGQGTTLRVRLPLEA